MRKDNVEAIYPLSPLQQGILFHANYDHRPGVYVVSINFTIHGDLDVTALKSAWQKMVERHSVLRSFIVWQEMDTPLQVVRRQIEPPWQEYDWTRLASAEQGARLERLLKTDQEQGYDLSKAPLHRLILIMLARDTHQLILSFHHILLDGWSVTVILDELFSFYRSFLGRSEPSLVRPQPFQAYLNWLGQQDLTTAETFWKEKLQGFSTPTSLTSEELVPGADRSRSGYDHRQLSLSRETSAGLRSLARENKLTMNTLFQGAWALLLSRYSGESDVVFGAAVSGRSVPVAGIESMVGLLIGSLPVRVKILPQESLIPWLGQLQDGQAQARQFEYSSMRDIQKWIGMDRSKGQALFDTILSFNNYALDRFVQEKTGNLKVTNVNFQEGSHYSLTMLIDPGEEIRIRIKYDCSRFDGAMIQRILSHLQVLLEQMAAQPDGPLSEFSLLTADEKKKLLVDFNDTEIPLLADRNVVRLIEEQVEAAPEAVALRFGDQTLSYRQLNQKANQLAHYLKENGIGPEKVVALCLDRSTEAVIAILGTLKAGGGYLPLDGTLPAARLKLMLEETQAPVILTNQKLAERLPGSGGRVVRLDADWPVIETKPVENLSSGAEADHMAYIIYTSGSTGRPKGAIVRHINLLSYITWARDFYLGGEVLDFPLFSSLSFDLTVTSIFVPLVSGGSIVVYGESEMPNMEVLDVVRDDRVDIIKLTPAHLTLLQTANVKASRLRKMIVGGEDFKRTLAQAIHDLFDSRIEIYNEYGPTEATVGCMIHRFDPETDKEASVPIGKPINNAQIYILDKNFQPVPPGVVGEMCIGGSGVARGYLQRPELTETRFVANPFRPGTTMYRTGDLARWTADGRMQFLGRSDHQVKIKGYRIELGEIESTLLEHPEIEDAVVTAFQPVVKSPDQIAQRCVVCGLPDNYPGASFDSAGVCKTCREFSELKERFRGYFKSPADLQRIVDQAKQAKSGKYDCIVLYSGGKDSTYMLYQLVKEYGVQPLVFNLDNGYISEEAKENVRRVTEALGVDLVFGQTPHMKAVFADSLKRKSNVCDGCFKVIYTLSINLARQKGIKYIFTGLSRGQLFETRLSDMFQARIFNVVEIDQTVLAARQAYHRVDDAVRQLLDVKVFEKDTVFDEVQLVDYYRYVDVPLSEVYQYLNETAHWVRPSDTGRSTNCLINDVGIYIHKKERGFHNYALPYSWDVRMGHKTREESIDELNDEIDDARVHRILNEIGYDENEKVAQRTEKRLVAYYVARQSLSTAALRQHLATRLPDYMIPSDFIRLEEMPLTVNGKVDRAALPDPDSSKPVFESDHAAPTTEHERQLVKVWSQVFRQPDIGIHDNFFELGGDSIISIQIVTKAKQAGLHFTPRDLFEQQTISQLALVVETDQTIPAEQGLVTGPVPLTPIQQWFFEQEFAEPHHWNQSLWLNVPRDVNREALQAALNHMPKQHDILRASYHRNNEGVWQQTIPAESVPLVIEFHDLSGLPAEAHEASLQDRARLLENTFSLENGPLLKAALFDPGLDGPMRIFVTCHHLVVDGVSWQPLLADWETAYRQICDRQPVQLSAKTTSFKEWAEKLVAYAHSAALHKELDYWRSHESEQPARESKNDRAVGSVERISHVLRAESTAALLHDAHEAYNTNVLDLLLTAWAQAFAENSGSDRASVVLEGHGRETELVPGVDLSHTVGWFTTQYPLQVRVAKTWDPGGLLKQVKEQLRRVPGKGLGYGALRYLQAEKALASQPTPPVLFNYMGQFERALPASDLFSLAQPLQAGYSPRNRRTHELEVNAFVRNGQLQFNIDFDTQTFPPGFVQAQMDCFANRLEELIAHCLSPDAGGHTPSDFALTDMTDEQFGRLSDLLNQMDG